MNVLYYFLELQTPMYAWQRYHFINELSNSDIMFNIFNPLCFSNIEEANTALIKEARKGIYDLFFTCMDSRYIFSETVCELKRMGLPTLLVCWDNLELPYLHKKIAPLFDVVWLTSYETQYLFEKWGCNQIVFQTYAANPVLYNPKWKQTIWNLGFIGSPYGSRANKINELLSADIPCSLYSDSLFQKGYNTSQGDIYKYNFKDLAIKSSRYLRFEIGRKVLYSTIKNKILRHDLLDEKSEYLRKNPSVGNDEMVELYSNLALSLNISELRDTYILKNPIHKIHLRTFEIPMSGGLEFTSYTDELASYFTEDKEIILYRSHEEMIDKAKYYLNEKRNSTIMKMKQSARRRAESEHTWTNRFNKVLLKLK